MKKVFLVIMTLCLIVSITGCKAPSFFLGMREQDFKAKNRGLKLLKATADGISIYQKTNYPFGKPVDVTFFYFSDGKLTQVDKGVTNPDLIIEHRN